jgi:ParB family chromosome partitioning protein
MTDRSEVRTIRLSQLVLSPTNVRKTPATAAEDAVLEASNRAKGILQNLIVHPASIDGRVYEVAAGGRRLGILRKLAAEGAIDADAGIPCKVEQAGEAIETSLMENTVRAAMHPADEFVAMAALADAGGTIEAVARRFGVSERHVRQRLRLGKLAPELLEVFRAGAISLEVVTAFTLGADHAVQLAVWRQVKDRPYIQPYDVRHLLTESAVALDAVPLLACDDGGARGAPPRPKLSTMIMARRNKGMAGNGLRRRLWPRPGRRVLLTDRWTRGPRR